MSTSVPIKLVFLFLPIFQASIICPEYVFKMIPLKDRLVNDYLQQYINLSAEECGEKCIETLNCDSFSYKLDVNSSDCYLHYKRVWAGQTYTNYSGLVTYWRLAGICPSNYIYNNTHNICYKAYFNRNDTMDWNSAQTQCEEDGGYLFIVNSMERILMVDVFFKSLTDLLPLKSKFAFTGGNDKLITDNWEWLDGSTTFRWATNEPNRLDKEKCVALSTTPHLSRDHKNLNCDRLEHFLCEIPVLSGQ